MNLDDISQIRWASLDSQINKVAEIIKKSKQKKDQLNIDKNQKQRFLIGVCGIPGSGKSTISQKLSNLLQKSVVLPMDGFHILRSLLTEQGIIRRGAAFTFDLKKFEQKITKIKQSKIGQDLKYPNFNHQEKDPVQDAISISPQTQIIIVQGLYVFDKNLKLNQIAIENNNSNKVWDFKIWVKSKLDTSIQRVARRHLQSGIEPTFQLASKRANSNDRTNGLYVMQNCFNEKQFQLVSEIDQNGASNSVIIDNSINFQLNK